MEHVEVLLDWVGERHDEVVRLLDAAHMDCSDADKVQNAWGVLAKAHAMDVMSDAMAGESSWEKAAFEAVQMLALLFRKYAKNPNEIVWHIAVPGLVCRVFPGASGAAASAWTLFAQPFSNQVQVEDVNREMKSRTANQCLRDAGVLGDMLPNAPLPVIAVASGALLALGSIGQIAGYKRKVFEDGTQWTALVAWDRPDKKA